MMSDAGEAGRSGNTPISRRRTSVEVVNARMGPDVDPRLREIMAVVVKHLHAAVKEIEPTHEEWLAAIRFLTETGHTCTDWRQEFILLSDTLGVSMLVDAINHRRPSGATENTILGPFYVPDAPRYQHGANICLDGKGEPMVVRGRVARHRRQSDPGRPDRRLADQRGRLLRRPAEGRAAGLEPARRVHGRRGRRRTGSARPSRATTRSRTTGRSAGCWERSAAIPTAPPTSTSS